MVLHLDDKARPVDASAGNLQIRLAETEDEVWAAQALRYRVFFQDMLAQPTAEGPSGKSVTSLSISVMISRQT